MFLLNMPIFLSTNILSLKVPLSICSALWIPYTKLKDEKKKLEHSSKEGDVPQNLLIQYRLLYNLRIQLEHRKPCIRITIWCFSDHERKAQRLGPVTKPAQSHRNMLIIIMWPNKLGVKKHHMSVQRTLKQHRKVHPHWGQRHVSLAACAIGETRYTTSTA